MLSRTEPLLPRIHAPFSRSAVPTHHYRRLHFQSAHADEIAANVAETVLSGFNPSDGCLEGLDTSMTTRFLRRSHRLLLERVHPAQTAHALLVEFDRFAVRCRLCRCGPQGFQFFAEPRKKRGLQLFISWVRQRSHRNNSTGTLQDRIISVVVEPMTRLRMRLCP